MIDAPAAAQPPDALPMEPWDEMVDGRRRVRPGWGRLFGTLSAVGHETLVRRTAQLERIFTDEGLTSLLPGATPVDWRCDPVPLLLGWAEFSALAAGLAQRARLLEAVLEDVYGPQALLAHGALPPELVFANPAFLRACRASPGEHPTEHPTEHPGEHPGRRLHLYAAELMRGPDGRWRVLADRTADAAGIAYALQNRRSLARVLPELFHGQVMSRLSPFFDAWQDALQRLAPEAGGNPSVVLLTGGPADKLWFEHVVLARELSCGLVEGEDLTVRDGVLYLKSLNGLRRIDVLLRRQDGRTLDPLELEVWTKQGIGGLLDAARSGTVRIVNDPGAGFAEAPGLTAFLPALSQRLLGEDLLLPGVPAVWLGDPAARARVLADSTGWRIRSAVDGRAPAAMLPKLPPEGREALLGRIEDAPGDFVAIAAMPPSVAPCLSSPGFEPRPVVVRMFLVFDGARWRALPGGLARVLSEDDLVSGRLPLHTLSKDVWVASEDEADLLGPAHLRVPQLAIRRTSGDLPSRVADNFFWLGRNLERLEGSARLIRIALARLERPGLTPRENVELHSLGNCLAEYGLLSKEASHVLGPAAVGGLLLQATRPKGWLQRLLGEVSRLSELLRDRLTREVYATLTHGLRGLRDRLGALSAEGSAGGEALFDITTAVLTFAATVAGLAAENMVRSGGRLFLDLGRRVERAWATAGAMACVLDQEGAAAQPARLEPGLRLSLELCDSVITYRSRYLTVLQPAAVLDLVLADKGNPRAVAFQIDAVRELLIELAGVGGSPLVEAAHAVMQDVQAIARDGGRGGPGGPTLTERLRGVEGATADLSVRITRQYFALLPEAHPLGEERSAGPLPGMA